MIFNDENVNPPSPIKQHFCHQWWNEIKVPLCVWAAWWAKYQFHIVHRTPHPNMHYKPIVIVFERKSIHMAWRCWSSIPVMWPPMFRGMHWSAMDQRTIVSLTSYLIADHVDSTQIHSTSSLIFSSPLSEMDPETASGETAPQYAGKVFEAILRGDYDLTPFPYTIIVWLRVTFPWFYYYLMIRRADRLASRYRSNYQSV